MKHWLSLFGLSPRFHPCSRCGKAIPDVVRFDQNTGSIGYLISKLLESGCYCGICGIWFCGKCSDRTKGLGSRNYKGGYLCLDCPQCKCEARTRIDIIKPDINPDDWDLFPIPNWLGQPLPAKTGWAILIGFLVVMVTVVAYVTLTNM
jgi:hypothetical protein